MKQITFEKDLESEWYVVLPTWPFEKDKLKVDEAASVFCDILAKDKNKVTVNIDEEPFEGYQYNLTFVQHDGGGGDYHFNCGCYDYPVWLGNKFEFIFGHLPDNVYL